VSARTVAASVLVRVFEDRAFAAAVLDAELSRNVQLDPRDAALATEIVYGVLRTKGFLEERLHALSRRGLPPEPSVLAHLLIGAYSIAFLDRVPVFAAVNEAVEGARAASGERGAGAAGYVNAVLRSFAKTVEAKGRPSLETALVEGAPGWLRGALRRSLGRRGATAFLSAGKETPKLGLAVRDAKIREEVLASLRSARPNAAVEPGTCSPRAILVRGAADPEKLPGLGEDFIIQEEGAQVVALSLGAKPGERVLDACAGRGNKAWFLAREVGPTGKVIACDLYPTKIAALAAGGAGKLGVETHAVDWTKGTGDVPGDLDRALVDAPCSGVGTLARRPEIALFRTSESLTELADLQIAIVRSVATRVREGGRLVFAVCSVLREETDAVVARLAEAQPGIRLEPAPFDATLPSVEEGATTLRLLPHVHGTDGYFMASFVVRRP
jgi:16S rRNA (cytosine967-C5)-methyltransferase